MTPLDFGLPFDSLALGITLAVTIAAFSIVWLFSLRLNDAGIVDYYWGLGFPVIGWLTLWTTGAGGPAAIIIMAAATLWAVRLTAHMISRHIRAGVEDPRYAKMRAAGGPGFKQRSLFTIFWLQGVLMWLIAAPLHAAGTMSLSDPNFLFWKGMALFFAGFLIESIADWQLTAFRNAPGNKGKVFTEGFFAWSRHPNYLGELMLWWGLGIAVFAVSGSPYVLIGPALLTLILLKLSGPPMLAAHMADRPGYAEWMARTPALLPSPFGKRFRGQAPAE
jgi:steroid 5-alpha reductase family enzyme